jgi:hypothetical protein
VRYVVTVGQRTFRVSTTDGQRIRHTVRKLRSGPFRVSVAGSDGSAVKDKVRVPRC